MLYKSSVRQSLRAPVRLAATFLVMALVCAFLAVGLNLRQVVKNNLELLEGEFDVVAVPKFLGSVDKRGRLIADTTNPDYAGYLNTYAEDFDLSVIRNASAVKDILVHKQFGAYLKSEPDLVPGDALTRNTFDIVIFTYLGTEPLVAEYWDTNDVKVSIQWSARGYDKIPRYEKGMKLLNAVDPYVAATRWPQIIEDMGQEDLWKENILGRKTGTFVLQPGQTYIASVEWYMAVGNRDGVYAPDKDRLHWMCITVDQAHSKQEVRYENGGFYTQHDPDAYHVTYPCIMPYTDGFWETQAGAYFRDAAEICKINGSALTVVTTEDLSMYLPFHKGNVYLSEGRSFTEEDYAKGNQVCIISKNLANENGWKLGHKIDMSFFEATYGFNVKSEPVASCYEPLVEHYDSKTDTYSLEMTDLFFDEGQYEIVGFYSGNVTLSDFSKDIQYTKDEGIDRRIIFVPQASVANQPEVPLDKYNTTILLDDETFMYFMSDMETSGLMEQKKDAYQVKFDIYDQGLGGMKQSLRQLDMTSRLILYVAVAVAVVVIVLLAFLTVLYNRRQIATLRSLGVGIRQIPAAVLSGILLICLLGALFGGVVGHVISDGVAGYILETAQQDLADTSFTATLAKTSAEKAKQYAIAIQSKPETAVLSVAVVLFSFTLLSCLLVLPEASKSPMLTLGAKE